MIDELERQRDRRQFLIAYNEWDAECLRIANKNIKVTSPFALAKETDVLENCTKVIAELLGLSATQFRDIFAAWRRAGYTSEKALGAVEAGAAL